MSHRAQVWVALWTTQGFGYSAFFRTGAIQYLWPPLLGLLVIWPYKEWLFGRPTALSWPTRLGHLAAAFLFGWWSEHAAAGLAAVGALLIGSTVASTDAAAVFFLLQSGGINLARRVRAGSLPQVTSA